MRSLPFKLVGLASVAGMLATANAVTVDETGAGPAEIVTIHSVGGDLDGTFPVFAGLLNLTVDGTPMNGFCIDPFHFSDGSMTGYQVVPLTSAPKGDFMSASTATELERLWGSYYSPTMSPQTAAGMQIAIWELVGGSGFKLLSANDFGAAGFLSVVENPAYDGPVASLAGLTGPGQDYAVASAAVASFSDPVPEVGSTLLMLSISTCGLLALARYGQQCMPRLAPVAARR